jgi:hypothetical protein
MELCLQQGVTCLSVGHRRTLIPYHNSTIVLEGGGGYAQFDRVEALQRISCDADSVVVATVPSAAALATSGSSPTCAVVHSFDSCGAVGVSVGGNVVVDALLGGDAAASVPRPSPRFDALFLRRCIRLLHLTFNRWVRAPHPPPAALLYARDVAERTRHIAVRVWGRRGCGARRGDGDSQVAWSNVLVLVTAGLSVSLAFITVFVAFVPGKVFNVRATRLVCTPAAAVCGVVVPTLSWPSVLVCRHFIIGGLVTPPCTSSQVPSSTSCVLHWAPFRVCAARCVVLCCDGCCYTARLRHPAISVNVMCAQSLSLYWYRDMVKQMQTLLLTTKVRSRSVSSATVDGVSICCVAVVCRS